MLKEALEYIIGLQKDPFIKEIDGQTYTDADLRRICHNPKAAPVTMHTLTSFVDYIKSGTDFMCGRMIISVDSPTKVTLYSQLDDEREREYLVEVNARIPSFAFNEFIDSESFIINMQTKFRTDGKQCAENAGGLDDKALLLKFAGTCSAESIARYSDDGISQKATIKDGIAGAKDALVPSPARLTPYRTFDEVAQPVSDFVFRLKKGRCDEVLCGLFEADGGAWAHEAAMRIKAFLEEQLSDYREQFTIIA